MNKDKVQKLKDVLNGIDRKDVASASEMKKKLSEAIDQIFSVASAKRDVKINFPEQIKAEIINWADQKEIEIPEFPEEMSIKNIEDLAKAIGKNVPREVSAEVKQPGWYKGFGLGELLTGIKNLLADAGKGIANSVFRVDLVKHQNPDKALAVYVVDRNGRPVNLNRSASGQLIVPGGDSSNAAEEFDVVNATIPTADTDVEVVLPKKTRQFFIKLDSQSTKLRIYKESGGACFTIPQNGWLSPTNLRLVDQTLILQASFTDGQPKKVELMIFK